MAVAVDAPAAASCRVGAGCSGSALPAPATSTHDTDVLSLYCWMTLKVMLDFFGSGPTLMSNWPNSPGLMAPVVAVQSISLSASVTGPSSVSMGVLSFSVITLNVQPGLASTETLASGVSVGSFDLQPGRGRGVGLRRHPERDHRVPALRRAGRVHCHVRLSRTGEREEGDDGRRHHGGPLLDTRFMRGNS